MIILKFGGTSVGSPEAIQQLGHIVLQAKSKKPVVVVSAFSGITNLLIDMGRQASEGNQDYKKTLEQIENRHMNALRQLVHVQHQSGLLAKIKMLLNELEDVLHGVYLLREATPRSIDLVCSFGERLSAYIVANHLHFSGHEAQAIDAREILVTNAAFGNAKIDFEQTNAQVKSRLAGFEGIPVVTGFIASTIKGETTTLGRGGSDYTAAVLGAALGVEEIQIWTDVNGMMTADPRLVKEAFTLSTVSYQEAMELSHFGAKVIYPPTLQPAFQARIPIKILNTFSPNHPGTTISDAVDHGDFPIKGISSIEHIALINLSGSGMVGVAGTASRMFLALAQHQVNIILITQASSEHSICVAIEPKHSEQAILALSQALESELEAGKIDPIEVQTGLSIVAVIGENMKRTTGVSGKTFTALGNNGINVVATAQGSSELNISVVIETRNLAKALNVLHESLFLSEYKKLHVFLVGPGLVGKTLIHQMVHQVDELQQRKHLKIRLQGICNSSAFLTGEEPISLETWHTWKTIAKDGTVAEFVTELLNLNLANTVLVDCTSNQAVIPHYTRLFEAGVSVVTPNKLANTADIAQYQKLQHTARKFNAHFLYETNVGAGLPIIGTLKGLIDSGDRVHKVEGILSGTLSYIFNRFAEGIPFKDCVLEAQEAGYTEPDPRDDLNGTDMARKMLILAREAGYRLEMSDISIHNFLPQSCMDAPGTEAFIETLEEEQGYFENMATQANTENKKWRMLGKLENGAISIGLELIDNIHPFWNLAVSDNIVAFYTDRYQKRPLVVQGPGAGAEVTAAGIFAELISLG